ncbi:MAG: DUF4252 domain-containing protein [Bacteroidales bacterium]|jgi:CII-binding regulator of phage lambda lysogenization HflD|nr:DUF4252 domain-containing protein [Bacteroidales bacterium]
MKKIIVIIAMMVFGNLVAQAQSPMDKLLSKYDGKDGYTIVNIDKELFEMMAGIQLKTSDNESQKKIDEMKKMASRITSLRVIKAGTKLEKASVSQSDELYKDIKSSIGKEFKEFMSVKEGKEEVKFYTRRSGSVVSELLVVAKDEKETTIVSLLGDIDLNSIAELTQKMNIKGMDKMKKEKK